MNEKAMKKALKIIDEVIEGKLKKYKLTLLEFFVFNNCAYELWKHGSTMLVDQNVKELLVKCGFKATESDIGWEIN